MQFINTNFSLFFKINLLLTTLLFLLFLLLKSNYTVTSFILVFLGAVSTSITLYIIYYIILFIFRPFHRLVILLSSLIFIFTNIALVVDLFIYKLYKFHINAMVINIITSPSAADSIQLGIAPVAVFIGVVLFFIFFEIFTYKKLVSLTKEYKEQLNKKFNKVLIIASFIIIVSEKVSYGFADLYVKNNILEKFGVIPLYQPLTFTRFAYKHFGIKPKKCIQNNIEVKALNYPKHQLQYSINSKKYNIFIIASDAVRNSSLNYNTAPNITKFKEDAIVFNNHRSGGNATRFGIFSLIYGVNSTYWFSFLKATQAPVLFDVLKHLNYDINIVSSTSIDWPEFRKTCYVDVQKSVYDHCDGSAWEKDKQSSTKFIKTIEDTNISKPQFGFLFMDAPHGYSFPKNFNKFGVENSLNYLTISKDSKELTGVKKAYKNAIFYDDYLFGKIIQMLKQKKLYDNSIIIFTSDHGQEFYEYGNFGHNSAFSKAQTNSPFIIKLPKELQERVGYKEYNNLSSHLDIVPTLLTILGVKNPVSDYSNGYNIFQKDYSRTYAFCANWNHNAIIIPKYTYVFSNYPNKMFSTEVRDSHTYNKVQNVSIDPKILLEIMNQNRSFLK